MTEIITSNEEKSYDRLNIPSKISGTIDELKLEIKYSLDNSNVIDKIKYVLSIIYFDKENREKEFNFMKNNKEYFSDEKIEDFFNKYNNQKISGKDWKKLIHTTGLLNWSIGKDGDNIKDRIDMIETISYYSIDATLRTGIHTGLFLQNIGKFFPETKDEIFEEFENNEELSGGLALTELSSGTNLFANYESKYEDNGDGTSSIAGIKHLQGLSDEATHWLFLAENKNKKGEFQFFIIDTRKENQNVVMIEEYDMDELKSITYGVNKFNAIVDNKYSYKIGPKLKKDFQSMLFESRMQFPAMINGALRRVYDEAKMKSELRDIGGEMINNDSVKHKLGEMKKYSNISNILNEYLIYKEIKLGEDNYHNEDLSIITKTISTEYMQKSCDHGLDLAGGLGFKKNNITRQMKSSAWPFTRFEGVNEMLYAKLSKIYKKKTINSEVLELIEKSIGLNVNKSNKRFNIYNLELNDSIKGYIFARIGIIEMIYEMGLDNNKNNEIKFLINEISQQVTKADNINTNHTFTEENTPVNLIKQYHKNISKK